jgi:hypothetical protein
MAQEFGLSTGVITIVVGLVFLLVGVLISSEVIEALNGTVTDGTDAQTTFDGVANNIWYALTIAGVAIIIVGAAIILSVMLGFGGQ